MLRLSTWRTEYKVLGICLLSLLASVPRHYYRLEYLPLELAGILLLALVLDPWWAAAGGLVLSTAQGVLLNFDYFYYTPLYVILGLYWGYATRLGLAGIFGQAGSQSKARAYLKFFALFVLASIFIYAKLKTILRILLFQDPGQDYSERLFSFWTNYILTGRLIPEVLRAFFFSLPSMLALILLVVYLVHKFSATPYLSIATGFNKQDLLVPQSSVLWYLFLLMLSLVCFLSLEGWLSNTACRPKLLLLIHSTFFWEIPLLVIGVLAYLLATKKKKPAYPLSIFITMLPPILIIWMILRLETEINLNLRHKVHSIVGGQAFYPQLIEILNIYHQKQIWLVGLVTIGIFAGAGIILLIIYSWNKDIRAAKDELEQKVIERTRKLAQAQEKLIQTEKLAVLGRLAAEVAHEVNNPLYGLINYADLLANKSRGQPPIHHYSQLIRGGLYYISAILKQLSSIPATQEPKYRPIDLAQVLDQALFLMDYKITTQRIQIEKHYGPDKFKIEADPQLLQQVFINLIHNALQAMKENDRLTIEVNFVAEDKVEIKFTDTGQGIPPEHLKDIFKPFFTTKRPMEGMGLGLTVCENFIKKHQGQIKVQSRVGKGTTFSIELPVRRGF